MSHVLGERLDDEIDVRRGRRCRRSALRLPSVARLLLLGRAPLLDRRATSDLSIAATEPSRLLGVASPDDRLDAGLRRHLGDPGGHLSGADDADRVDVHGVPLLVSRTSQGARIRSSITVAWGSISSSGTAMNASPTGSELIELLLGRRPPADLQRRPGREMRRRHTLDGQPPDDDVLVRTRTGSAGRSCRRVRVDGP